MLYRRYPYYSKRHSHYNIDSEEKETSGSIPLPNEEEPIKEINETREIEEVQERYRPSLLDFIKKHIHLEEIILLGLIFILLDEGIDDDFLLIMLIYILLT
ncbi:MAG: hypothetical protein ACOX7R_11320 [Acetivibrionales bacterium]|jgi:hypothetical protein